MKKKNLIILLVFPFLIALLCIIAVNTTYNRVDVDISFIEWEYNDMEGFQISKNGYPLRATGVNQRYYQVSSGNELVWSVENRDAEVSEPCAEIYESGGTYFLRALREGEVTVTCSNKKGNVQRRMTGIIYKDAAILLYPTVGGSQTNIDSTIYYGEYDHARGTPASIEMTIVVLPSSATGELTARTSGPISYDEASAKISIGRVDGAQPASLTMSLSSGIAKEVTYAFEIVDEGVNVYTYDDLLECTNRSQTGEIAVLRKSFESLQNAYMLDSTGAPISSVNGYRKKAANVECFGVYDSKKDRYNFADEVHRFKTTYNRSFIDQWNAFANANRGYDTIPDELVAGLHVQKDFYGNGYTINLHNLTYPYAYEPVTTETGETVRFPHLRADNLFRGPLKLYTLGDPNGLPIVSLYGQDNVGMYVDGDNITINDLHLKGCDFGDRLANLATVGNVMEIRGRSVTVKNSRIQNGRNVIRSFSSMDLTLSNCLVSNAQNFLFVTGANEYVEIDQSKLYNFKTLSGEEQVATLEAYFRAGGAGDDALNEFILHFSDSPAKREQMRAALNSIQDAMNDVRAVEGKYKGSTEITDCYFSGSGVSAICLESLFNSPFLEMGSPTFITSKFSEFDGMIKSLIPYTAMHVSGVSYPVKVNISGDTRFYDYKEADKIELDGLIEENISDIAAILLGSSVDVSIDVIFPLRRYMVAGTSSINQHVENGVRYLNIPVAYYGGGLNLSKVSTNGYDHANLISAEIDVDMMDYYLDLKSTERMNETYGLVLKTVITVIGYEPFSFRFVREGFLFGETPKIADLIAHAKGA